MGTDNAERMLAIHGDGAPAVAVGIGVNWTTILFDGAIRMLCIVLGDAHRCSAMHGVD